MSFRAWMFAATIGLGLATLGQAQNGDGEQQRAQENQTPAQILPVPLPIELIENEAETQAREARDEEAAQREIADLAAQEGMNDSTRAIKDATIEMRDYALYSTIAVWIGTALLVFTLILTAGANRAAHKAVSLTREVGRDQTRAYVHADAAELTWGGDHAPNPGIEISILNTGQTPAKWFSLVAKLEFVDLDPLKHTLIKSQMSVSEIDFKEIEPSPWSALGGQKNLTAPALKGDDYAAIKKRYATSSGPKNWDKPAMECGLQIFRYVDYETIFGEVCRSEFCFGVRRAPKYRNRTVREEWDPVLQMSRPIKEEIPIKMQRISANAKTYHRRER